MKPDAGGGGVDREHSERVHSSFNRGERVKPLSHAGSPAGQLRPRELDTGDACAQAPEAVGTGNITLYWYALCCLFTFFVLSVAGGLVLYGKWKRRRARKRAEARKAPGSPDADS
ncbi:MAG: hypothetical protein AAF411_30635 [Myxococcota bacterium]